VKSSAQEPLFSTNKLYTLSKGNEEFVKKMIRLFIETAPENVKKLKEAFENKDFQTLKGVAHTMKPNLDMFDIKSLYATIRSVEVNAGKGENQDDLQKDVNNVVTTLDEVLKELAKLC
jgi:HPt (histidine-containing phosphotransfer) domain-containing protein